jgi:hypothetical protein
VSPIVTHFFSLQCKKRFGLGQSWIRIEFEVQSPFADFVFGLHRLLKVVFGTTSGVGSKRSGHHLDLIVYQTRLSIKLLALLILVQEQIGG